MASPDETPRTLGMWVSIAGLAGALVGASGSYYTSMAEIRHLGEQFDEFKQELRAREVDAAAERAEFRVRLRQLEVQVAAGMAGAGAQE